MERKILLLLVLLAGPPPGPALEVLFEGHRDLDLPSSYYTWELLDAPSPCACRNRCLVYPPCTAFTLYLTSSGEVDCFFTVENVTNLLMKPKASSWTFCKQGCKVPTSSGAGLHQHQHGAPTTASIAAETTTTSEANDPEPTTTTTAAAPTTTTATATTTTGPGPKCAESFTDLGVIGCYHIHEVSMKYSSARTYCQGLNADLATPAELDPLRAYLIGAGMSGEYWVGLEHPDGWIDGRPVDPSEWADGEPNNSGPCSRLKSTSSFKAADHGCNNLYKVICEQEL
ncbi:uncharacterized protein LOC122244593 [Penaeus japonicus]|uniref:uncharacterized protein LOC122244593 n=1 Tax=Penaeus japonicus TaxID=27405 RepID=UPI001C70C32B|nr:uncharacterized protein LOC122244593 [Penaeus japonicus]